MEKFTKVLMLFFALLFSSVLTAQTGNGGDGNGYTPDWMIGSMGKPSNKVEYPNYVSDWQMLPQLETAEEQAKPFISDWHVFEDQTPRVLSQAEQQELDEIHREEALFFAENNVSTQNNAKQGPTSRFINDIKTSFGGENIPTRTEQRFDDQQILVEENVFDSKTNALVMNVKYAYLSNGEVIQDIIEYYPNGTSISKKYSIKNGKIHGQYEKYSLKNGNLIISCLYSNGILEGNYYVYYSEIGKYNKVIKFNNGIKVSSTEYDKNGEITKENVYNAKGELLTTYESTADNSGLISTDYGFVTVINKIRDRANISKTPAGINGNNFMLDGFLINEIKTKTGVSNPPSDYKGDILAWYADQAITHIIKNLEPGFKLSESSIDLIFADQLIFALEHLARKYEIAGDRENAENIRYDVIILGFLVEQNLMKHATSIGRDDYQIVLATYNNLNIGLMAYSGTKMDKLMENRNLTGLTTTNSMLKAMTKYEGKIRIQASKIATPAIKY